MTASTAQRPNEEALRALWKGFTANWGYLSEEERTELLPLLVEKITMEEKEKGTLHLILQSPLVRFAFQRYLGADSSRKPNFLPDALSPEQVTALAARRDVNPSSLVAPLVILTYGRKAPRRTSAAEGAEPVLIS